jgi:hypothetical protein
MVLGWRVASGLVCQECGREYKKLRYSKDAVPGGPAIVRILGVGKKIRNVLLIAGQEIRL